MTSIPETSTNSKHVHFCLTNLVVLLVLSSSRAHGASLRDPSSYSHRGNANQAPDVDMLKALEYIESLRHRAGTDSQKQHSSLSAGYDNSHVGGAEKLRAMLTLASDPTQSKDAEEENEEAREDKSEELLQAVLNALQQTERVSKPDARTRGRLSDDAHTMPVDVYPWVQQGQYKRLLPMVEDVQDEGGEEEEDEDEGPDLEHESHFKRTNENVEEKYTPQNLATLQSVFDELDKLTSVKTKRQDEEDNMEEGDEEDEDDDDLFNIRNVAYNDLGEAESLDWAPRQEGNEDEEEERDNNHEADRGLDYFDDNDEEDDEDNEEEDEGEGYPVKRSKNSEDVANLVDYYLLKVLEKSDAEKQKREIDEEEEKKRARTEYTDEIFPQTIYKFIQMSQKYQIPPEDMLDMLQTREMTKQYKTQKNNMFSKAQSKLSQISSHKTHKIPEAEFYSRRLPEELRTEEILNILGFGGLEDPVPVRKQTLSRLQSQPVTRSQDSGKDKYDDTVDEDELAAYLAAQMPVQYLKPVYSKSNNNNNNKASEKRGGTESSMSGSFEQAIQDYFDQMDSDEKRQTEDGNTQTQGFENEAVMKLLSYLKPETEESESDAKTDQGI